MNKLKTGILMLLVGITLLGLTLETAAEPKKEICPWNDEYPEDDYTCLYTPSGNIHVYLGDNQAGICTSTEKFTEDVIEAKLADGWFTREIMDYNIEEAICKLMYPL